MLIKLYNNNNEYIKTLNCESLKIVETLASGYKIAQFKIPLKNGIIKEEEKVIIDNYLYVIKEVNIEDNNYYQVYCKPYFGTLNSQYCFTINTENGTLENYLIELLSNTDWNYHFNENIPGLISFQLNNSTILESLNTIFELFNVDIFYDTLNRTIEIWKNKGIYKSDFYLNETNLNEWKMQSHTYDLITRLIPLGKDKLTIADVNDGQVYLDNHIYTNENIVGFYINDKISSPFILKQLAENKLATLAIPYTNYCIKLTKFNNVLQTGDLIKIIDTYKDLNNIVKINKIIYYPDQPENSYIEAGQPQILFNNIYKDFNNQYNIFFNNTYTKLN